MKYIKCTCSGCHKRATRRFRGINFCDEHEKEIKRTCKNNKKVTGVFSEMLVTDFSPLTVYRDVLVKLK